MSSSRREEQRIDVDGGKNQMRIRNPHTPKFDRPAGKMSRPRVGFAAMGTVAARAVA